MCPFISTFLFCPLLAIRRMPSVCFARWATVFFPSFWTAVKKCTFIWRIVLWFCFSTWWMESATFVWNHLCLCITDRLRWKISLAWLIVYCFGECRYNICNCARQLKNSRSVWQVQMPFAQVHSAYTKTIIPSRHRKCIRYDRNCANSRHALA